MNAIQQREIEALYIELYDFLISYAQSSLNSDPLSEEAVQETFRIACNKPNELLSSPNPKGWILNTLKNVIYNTVRKRARANALLNEYLRNQDQNVVSRKDIVDIDVIYGNLADTEEFMLVKAFAVEGKSVLELAEELGISYEACKKRLQCAKRTLRRKIYNC